MPEFSIRTGDLLPALESELSRDRSIVDLTLATSVQLVYRSAIEQYGALVPSGDAAVTVAASVDGSATLGRVRHDWVSPETNTAGTYLAYWLVTWPGSKQESFPNRGFFPFEITAEL